MLSVFKLVSCKHGAFRELALRPEGLRSSKCFKIIFKSSENYREGMCPTAAYKALFVLDLEKNGPSI